MCNVIIFVNSIISKMCSNNFQNALWDDFDYDDKLNTSSSNRNQFKPRVLAQYEYLPLLKQEHNKLIKSFFIITSQMIQIFSLKGFRLLGFLISLTRERIYLLKWPWENWCVFDLEKLFEVSASRNSQKGASLGGSE